MDDRKFVKFLSIGYHRKFDPYRKMYPPNGKVGDGICTTFTVYSGNESAGLNVCACYVRGDDGEMIVSPPEWKIEETIDILRYFDNPENITDEEWNLFKMMEPEKVKRIGSYTSHFCQCQLYLEGRLSTFRIPQVIYEISN